jgi:tetratricopeptide (TPR) repeat protein
MKRLASISRCLALVIVIMMVVGCGGVRIVPLSAKIDGADRKFERAESMQIRTDTPENKKKDLAKQQQLYDEALASYLEIIAADPNGKYFQRAHFQVGQIYKKLYQWDKSIEHYQAIVDVAPTGYLGGRAKSSIADIRKNRQIIQEKTRTYQNRRLLEDEESQNLAAEALFDVARAYQELGNSQEAIRQFEKLVAEFSKHRLAPQAQFQVGNIYFYKLYDYSNEGGWGAFVKVAEKFPDSYEAGQATTILKESMAILTEIKKDQDDILKYTNKKAIEYEASGREVLPSERFVMGYDERIVQDYQNIARGWIQMKNYPFAIAAYRELATKLSYKKFAAADALYWIGDLYQKDGEYERAIAAFDEMQALSPESTWRDEAVYQQAVCYRAIREFEKAYQGFKAYLTLSNTEIRDDYFREAEQMVRQYELDQDGDGYLFYQEQEAGTSDQDPNDHPGASAATE